MQYKTKGADNVIGNSKVLVDLLSGRNTVISCCTLNNTQDCDEYLFGQVSTLFD